MEDENKEDAEIVAAEQNGEADGAVTSRTDSKASPKGTEIFDSFIHFSVPLVDDLLS